MTILAIDVTSPCGSLAIHSNGVIVAELHLSSPDGFAHILFPAIEELLGKAELRLSDIDCFASASGPGAFTGVRVGLTTVKGLAEAVGRPASGVSNLRALSTFGHAEQRAVILDARREDVFAAIYSFTGELAGEEVVTRLESWVANFAAHAGEIVLQDPGLLNSPTLPVIQAPKHLAAAVALCAASDGKKDLWVDPAALDANYVRRSDAELFWKETP